MGADLRSRSQLWKASSKSPLGCRPFRDTTPIQAMQAETIIVGAGSCGAVIAARATEGGGHDVLLLEAGPDYPEADGIPPDLRDGTRNSMRAHDWGYLHRPTARLAPPLLVPARQGRRRVVGGEHVHRPARAAARLRRVGVDGPPGLELGEVPARVPAARERPRREEPVALAAGAHPDPAVRARGARAVAGGVPRGVRHARLPALRRLERSDVDGRRPARDEPRRRRADERRAVLPPARGAAEGEPHGARRHSRAAGPPEGPPRRRRRGRDATGACTRSPRGGSS